MRDIFRKGWFALDSDKFELTGTPNQVEWAEQIRLTVAQEFDRVARVFHAQAGIQTGQKQSETRTISRSSSRSVRRRMAIRQAGYFIREWQELSDQVRQMIAKDPRYQAVKDQRAARRRAAI